jgi:branched-subunit amino acid ABC-type transport system permease component
MPAYLAQLIVNGLLTGTILALTGVGASLVFGIRRIANFAHGEYLTFAAYVALLLNAGLDQNIAVATAGATAATALLAVAIHFLVLRPLRGRGLVALSLITTGVGLMLRNVIVLGAGPRIRQYGIDQAAVFDLGLVRIFPGQALALAIAAVVAPAVALLLARTRLGTAMRAVADNRDLAAISGIDVDGIGAYVWLLAGGLAGLGGVMFGVVQGTLDPNLGFQVLSLIFTTVGARRDRERLRGAHRGPRAGPRDGPVDVERLRGRPGRPVQAASRLRHADSPPLPAAGPLRQGPRAVTGRALIPIRLLRGRPASARRDVKA